MIARWARALPLIAAVIAAPAIAGPTPDTIEVATTAFDTWQVQATTRLRWQSRQPDGVRLENPVPFYSGGQCEATSDSISFAMDEKLALEWLSLPLAPFTKPSGEIMPRRTFTLEIDGVGFDFGYNAALPRKLIGFDYPAIYKSIPGFMGAQAFRKPGDDEWIAISRLFDFLLDAETGRILVTPQSFQFEDEAVDGELRQTVFQLDLAGFKRAAQWCAQTLLSPKARTLPSPDRNGQ